MASFAPALIGFECISQRLAKSALARFFYDDVGDWPSRASKRAGKPTLKRKDLGSVKHVSEARSESRNASVGQLGDCRQNKR